MGESIQNGNFEKNSIFALLKLMHKAAPPKSGPLSQRFSSAESLALRARAAAPALSLQPPPAGPALWFAAPPCLRPTSVVLNLLGALRAVADVVLTARRRC